MLSLSTDKIHATGFDQFGAAQNLTFAHSGEAVAHQFTLGQANSELASAKSERFCNFLSTVFIMQLSW